jgi:hypothetical protein
LVIVFYRSFFNEGPKAKKTDASTISTINQFPFSEEDDSNKTENLEASNQINDEEDVPNEDKPN